ncbi:MAG TPA: cytochrome P450 [Ktedonobacterales bacterium]|jgi:cytochrome P450|nr:cytochrome P450 [Ktedonobacterales bacterium]
MTMSAGVKPFEQIPLVELPDDYQTRTGPFLAEMYRKHGPIFRASNFNMDIVYLVGPEANRFVLLSDRLKFSHHEGWGKLFSVSYLFGDGLLSMDGPEHDAHRRIMNPAFAISYMDRYVPLMNRIIRERIATWGERGEVDVYEEARKITFDVAAEALTGLRAGPEVDRFREVFSQMLMLGMMVSSQQEWDTRMTALRAELDSLIRPKIAARRAHPTDDILGLLVTAKDSSGQPLSDERIIAHANILLVAGHETSTSLASWLLYQLTQQTEITQRVLDEQLALVGPTAEPTLDDIKRMKYLDLVLLEAERVYPPVSNGPRGVVEDFEFAGYHVPAGTYAFYSIAASHLLPEVFAQPEVFDPERFAPPREEHKRTPYGLVGFGGGPRVCIGINFAKVEIKALVSQALRRYELEAVPDQTLVQFYRVTAVPLYGIRLRVRERDKVE